MDTVMIFPVIGDEAAVAELIRCGMEESGARRLVAAWRQIPLETTDRSDRDGYNGPVLWKVRQGFTLGQFGAVVGMCHPDLCKDLDEFGCDEEIQGSLWFWMPRFVARTRHFGSLASQTSIIGPLRERLQLPSNHLTLGSVTLLGGLALAYHRLTGDWGPLERFFGATSSTIRGGTGNYRVFISACCQGLFLQEIGWGFLTDQNHGIFPLGQVVV